MNEVVVTFGLAYVHLEIQYEHFYLFNELMSPPIDFLYCESWLFLINFIQHLFYISSSDSYLCSLTVTSLAKFHRYAALNIPYISNLVKYIEKEFKTHAEINLSALLILYFKLRSMIGWELLQLHSVMKVMILTGTDAFLHNLHCLVQWEVCLSCSSRQPFYTFSPPNILSSFQSLCSARS